MKLRLLTRLAVRAFFVFSAVASVVVGCSGQAEGERCDFEANGDADCDDGLVCVACERLAENVVDRCCRPDGSSADSRCALAGTEHASCLTQIGSGGSTSNAGASGSGTSGSAGSSMGGMSGTGTGGTAGEGDQPAGAAGVADDGGA
jgi:hypothetical protein